MKLSAVILLCACLSSEAATTTYTEWYAIKGVGTNVNSGSTPDANPTFSASSGNWTNSTGTFFKTALDPVAGGVTNGAWASICTNLTTTNAWFIGMVTNASDSTDTIQLSQVAFMGVNPADRVGDVFIRVGGAWAGPNTNTMANGGGFPFAFLANTATNSPNVTPCCNIKGGTTYGISNAITHALAGPIRWQGYTTTVRDGGKASFDGGTTLNYYILLTASCVGNDFVDLIFSNNGGTGTGASGVVSSGARNVWNRCVFHDVQRIGLDLSANSQIVSECEAYACDKQNSALYAGFHTASTSIIFNNCISHDNTGNAASGFFLESGNVLINCISESNGAQGVLFTGSGDLVLIQCDFYNNTGNGVSLTTASDNGVEIQNCNFIKNGIYGANITSGSSIRHGNIFNCAFGSGTQTNSNGGLSSLGGSFESGSITYSSNVTPWADPANGDFRITLSEAKSVGRGSFTQTASSYTGTVGYPDIGAAQSASTNATTRAFGFSQ